MKKLILAATIALSSTFAIANTPVSVEDVKVSYAAEQAFIREFGAMENVTWKESKSNLYKASFELYTEKVSAYFTHDGNLIATATEKEFDQLPGKLRNKISTKMADATISEIFELNTENEHSYYFKATENGKSKLYKGFSNGSYHESSIAIH